MSNLINSFEFKVENENVTWRIPVTNTSNSISINSNWSKQNLQGSTEAISAFNYTDNPSITITLRFHEDLINEYKEYLPSGNNRNYLKICYKLSSLVYPITIQNTEIRAPYVMVYYNNQVYRGYFTSVKLDFDGPIRGETANGKGYQPVCNFIGSFTVVKRFSPVYSGVAYNMFNYFNDSTN